MSTEISERFRLTHYFKFIPKQYGISKLLRGIFAYCYKKLRMQFLDLSKERTIKVHGCDFSLMPYDKGISVELLLFGVHEPLCTNLLPQILKEGMICVEAGSNIGYYAVLESKIVGKNGKVIAIEASPDNYKYLQKNATQQNYSTIETYNFAVSNTDGEVYLQTGSVSNWSKVIEKNENPNPSFKITKIPAKTLDSFLEDKKVKKIDFFRMDVEGYEFNIYKGMKQTIAKFKPILMIEFHKIQLGSDKLKKFLHELNDDGYKAKYFLPRVLDNPMMADKKDIQSLRIEDIIEKVDDNSIPMGFTLILYNVT